MEMIYQGDKLPFYADLTLTGDDVSYVSPGVGNPTVSLYNSSDTIVGSIENVAVTGKESGNQATLTCWYVVDSTALSLTAGDYRLVFKATIKGETDDIERVVSNTVDIRVLAVLDPFHGIYNAVRAKLRRTVAQLPDTDESLQLDAFVAVSIYLPTVPCLTSGTLDYADVAAGADKVLFDRAMGIAVAASRKQDDLTESLTSEGGQGMVTEETVGPTRTKYSGGSSTAASAVATSGTNWENQVTALLSQLSCVKAARLAGPAKGAGGGVVGLAGYRRAQDAKCGSYYRRRC